MTHPRAALPALLLFAGLVSQSLAADLKWDVARTTAPDDVAELKALQEQVRKVVDKCTAATVGVRIGPGAGSGVIVNEDGLVLTAAHVSGDPGRDCTLILQDGRTVKGKTLGINEGMDSGMIQITDKGPKNGKWPFAEMAKAADLKKGQWVVSLGHPGGYKPDRPPVARLGRVQELTKSVVRTDCTLVGGDSGGPLFDLNGKVVGIHSRIGMTLAQNIHVPSDAFKDEWDQLAKGDVIGRRPRGSPAVLGVVFDDGTPDAKLASVEEDGPAAKAGLKSGDYIVKIAGTKVKTADDVRDVLRTKKPGDEVSVEVKRDTKTVTLTVKLGRRMR